MLLKGLIRAGVARALRIDTNTGALIVMSHDLHSVQDGEAYIATLRTAVDAFDIAAPMIFEFITPDSVVQMHLDISGESNTAAYVELFEDNGNASHYDIADGAAVTEINRNRQSTNTTTAVLLSGGAITQATADVLLASKTLAKSGNEPDPHFMLARNTRYIIRATSYDDNNEGSLMLAWHEHTAVN